MNFKAHHGAIYFITLIDNYSQYGYVYLLSHRYEILDMFEHFIVEVETQFYEKLKLFILIEVVKFSFICSKGFVKRKAYKDI